MWRCRGNNKPRIREFRKIRRSHPASGRTRMTGVSRPKPAVEQLTSCCDVQRNARAFDLRSLSRVLLSNRKEKLMKKYYIRTLARMKRVKKHCEEHVVAPANPAITTEV